MRLRSRILVSIILLSLVMAAIGASAWLTVQQVAEIDDRRAHAARIARGASELDYQADDYLVNRNPQSLVRWRRIWDSVQEAVRGVTPADARQRALLDSIEADLDHHKTVIGEIERIMAPGSEPVAGGLGEVMRSRVAVQSQSLAFHAQQLGTAIDAEGNLLRERSNLLGQSLLGAFAAYVLFGYLLLYRGWLASLTALQRGAAIVGSGDLEFSIPVSRKDEIGDLTRAFNRMTSDLRGAVSSKAELEREVSERKQAESALEGSLARTTLLKDLASAVGASLDSEDLSREVLSIAAGYLGADSGEVRLLKGGVLESLRPVAALGEEGRTEEETAVMRDLAERAILAGAFQLEERSQEEGGPEESTATAKSLRIALPVYGRGVVIGAVSFGFPEERSFTEDEIELLGAVASVLGTGLENARLYETQRGIADQLQEALLSLPGHIDGIEFAHAYHSASEEARVGGDFYDLFELGGGRLGITVGDVAGKGLDAAVLTSLAKNGIRAHANEKGKGPSQVLALTNDLVFRSTPVEAFVTVFFGILDCASGELVYANAGHTVAAIVRPDEGVTVLPVTGPLVGAFAEVRYAESAIQMHVGDTLFLYTDGLTEARSDDDFYGEARLFDLLTSATIEDAEELIQAVVSDVLAFSGCVLRDDLAALALRRTGEDAGRLRRPS